LNRTVITPECMVCHQHSVMVVDDDAYTRWRNGELIQVAFPNMPKELREQLKTGYHPACWNKIFAIVGEAR
jgi:hypothetical protein